MSHSNQDIAPSRVCLYSHGVQWNRNNKLSLAGLRIVVTGSRRATELARLIMNFGGIPHIVPTIGIEINQGVSGEIEAFISKIVKEKMDYIIFMTGPGVYSLMFAAKRLGLERKLVESLNQVVVICRSFKSKYALSNHGVTTDAVPEENTGEGIAKLMKNYAVDNKNVAIVWHGSHSAVLSDELFKS